MASATKKSKNLILGFGKKDSSDSKSHDSGIDSIEKPGMSFGVLMFVGVNIDPGQLIITKKI